MEFRVRQAENYIKYTDELKDLKTHKDGKRSIKSKEVHVINDKIDVLERKSNDFSERLLTMESKFVVLDKDLRQQYHEFEQR